MHASEQGGGLFLKKVYFSLLNYPRKRDMSLISGGMICTGVVIGNKNEVEKSFFFSPLLFEMREVEQPRPEDRHRKRDGTKSGLDAFACFWLHKQGGKGTNKGGCEMQDDAPRWGFPFPFGMIPRFLLIFHIFHRKCEGKVGS